jgi:hypothetical protein
VFYSIHASARARLASLALPSCNLFAFLSGNGRHTRRDDGGSYGGGNSGHSDRDDASIHMCSDVHGHIRHHMGHISQSPQPISPIPMYKRYVSEATTATTDMSPPASPEPSTMRTATTTRAGTPLPSSSSHAYLYPPPNCQDSIASSTAQTSSSVTAAVSPKSRFATAVRSVMMLQSATSGPFRHGDQSVKAGDAARAVLQAEHHHQVAVPSGETMDLEGRDDAIGEGVSGDGTGVAAIARILPSDQLPPTHSSLDLPQSHHHHHVHVRTHTPSTRKKAKEATQMRKSRVANLVPRLKSMEVTQDLAAHQALVRHLQFSPNGQWLATSSWDRTSVVFRVGVSV